MTEHDNKGPGIDLQPGQVTGDLEAEARAAVAEERRRCLAWANLHRSDSSFEARDLVRAIRSGDWLDEDEEP